MVLTFPFILSNNLVCVPVTRSDGSEGRKQRNVTWDTYSDRGSRRKLYSHVTPFLSLYTLYMCCFKTTLSSSIFHGTYASVYHKCIYQSFIYHQLNSHCKRFFVICTILYLQYNTFCMLCSHWYNTSHVFKSAREIFTVLAD